MAPLMEIMAELLSLLWTHLVLRRMGTMSAGRVGRRCALATLEHSLAMGITNLLTKMCALSGIQAGRSLIRPGRTDSARQGQSEQGCDDQGQNPLHVMHFRASRSAQRRRAR